MIKKLIGWYKLGIWISTDIINWSKATLCKFRDVRLSVCTVSYVLIGWYKLGIWISTDIISCNEATQYIFMDVCLPALSDFLACLFNNLGKVKLGYIVNLVVPSG